MFLEHSCSPFCLDPDRSAAKDDWERGVLYSENFRVMSAFISSIFLICLIRMIPSENTLPIPCEILPQVRVFTALFPNFVVKAFRNIILPVGSGKPGLVLMGEP